MPQQLVLPLFGAISFTKFAVFSALFYLSMKVVLKCGMKVVAKRELGFWDILGWFGVDLSVLVLAVSLPTNAANLYCRPFSEGPCVGLYFAALISIVVFAVISYGIVIAYCKERWYVSAAASGTSAVLFGLAPLDMLLNILA